MCASWACYDALRGLLVYVACDDTHVPLIQTEIRVQFKLPVNNLFSDLSPNEVNKDMIVD